MRTTFTTAAESYLRAKALSHGTRNEYHSTLRKWNLEFPTNSGQRLAVGRVVRPLVLGRGDVPQ